MNVINSGFYKGFQEGYQEGLLIGKIETVMKYIDIPFLADKFFAEGSFTEFQRQQALFYKSLNIEPKD